MPGARASSAGAAGAAPFAGPDPDVTLFINGVNHVLKASELTPEKVASLSTPLSDEDKIKLCLELADYNPKLMHGGIKPTKAQAQFMLEALLSMGDEDELIVDKKMADKFVKVNKTLVKGGKTGLDDPGAGLRIPTQIVTKANSWTRPRNTHMKTKAKEVRAVEDMSKKHILRHGYMEEPEPRVALSTAYDGLHALAFSEGPDSAPPLLIDLVAAVDQKNDFDKESGGTSIDEHKTIAKTIFGEAAERRKGIFHEGDDSEGAMRDVIRDKKLIVMPLNDLQLAVLVKGYDKDLRATTSADDTFASVLLTLDLETKNVCVMTSVMQQGSTTGGPATIHRLGDCAIRCFHEINRAFLTLVAAPNVDNVFPPFTKVTDSPLHKLLTPVGAAEMTKVFHEHGILPPGRALMAATTAGGKAGQRTDEGEAPGVHWSNKLQRMTMPTQERVEAAPLAKLEKPTKNEQAAADRERFQAAKPATERDAAVFYDQLTGVQGKPAQRKAIQLYKKEKRMTSHPKQGGRKMTSQVMMKAILKLRKQKLKKKELKPGGMKVGELMDAMEEEWPLLAADMEV